MNEDFSLLVIVHGRAGHLQRLLDGVDRSSRRPIEVVVVYMDDPSPEPVTSGMLLKTVHISSNPAHHGLPLARARNTAVGAAVSDLLVFLDVDCIPSESAFEQMLAPLHSERGSLLAMAEPRYLREPLPTDLDVDDASLMQRSVVHRGRVDLPRDVATGHHEMFWSLAFATTRRDFVRIGGFDENYVGYGAEDTDFAFRARAMEVRMFFSPAPVFHQHHGVLKPPLNHFAAIVRNAQRFFDCWGVWPMTGWLTSFAEHELITWDRGSHSIDVVRHPSPREIEAVHSRDPY